MSLMTETSPKTPPESSGSRWAVWQENATAAHTVPFFTFLGLMLIPGSFEINNPELPWWRYQPQIWFYPIQCLIVGLMIAFWWRHYQFRPLGLRPMVLGMVVGAVGIGLWLLPNWLHRHYGWEVRWPGSEKLLLGFHDRPKGFNPDVFAQGSAAWWITVVLRFLRGVLIVPLIEEPFWRSFLWRSVADRDQRWQRPPFGLKHGKAILLTSIAMMLAHSPQDYATCLIWSLLISMLAVSTRSLGACVVAHATSNLLMNIYIMTTREYGFW
jgi:uncharacterized protein